MNNDCLFPFQTCVLITEGGCTLGPHTGTTPEDDEQPDATTVENSESTESAEVTTEKVEVTTEKAEVTTEKTEVTTPAPICRPGVFGNVQNPDDCGSFYMCTNGMAILLRCTEGFEYDPDLRVS